MGGLTGQLVMQSGAAGLVAVTVWMILTGRLVPGKERDYWRDLAQELARQNSDLLEGARASTEVSRALSDAVKERP
jgi:hypothetical protein